MSTEFALQIPLVLPPLYLVGFWLIWTKVRSDAVRRNFIIFVLLSLPLVFVALQTLLAQIADCRGGNVAFQCAKSSLEPLVLLVSFGDTSGFLALSLLLIFVPLTLLAFVVFFFSLVFRYFEFRKNVRF